MKLTSDLVATIAMDDALVGLDMRSRILDGQLDEDSLADLARIAHGLAKAADHTCELANNALRAIWERWSASAITPECAGVGPEAA